MVPARLRLAEAAQAAYVVAMGELTKDPSKATAKQVEALVTAHPQLINTALPKSGDTLVPTACIPRRSRHAHAVARWRGRAARAAGCAALR